jgi:glycine/D-amino acid oxidase-like deaminating enzyme
MSGNVEWATGDAAGAKLFEKARHLRDWGYPVELLAREELRSLEPDVVPPDDVSGIAFYPNEGFVDVPPLLGALARTAQAVGARIHAGTRVIDLVRTGERVTGVVTSDGTRLTSDWVVSCVGPRTGQFARLAGIDLPVARSVGLLAISQASSVQLRTIVHSPLVNLRPDGAGRIMMRATEFDRAVQEDTPLLPFPQACGVLMERAVRILPGLAGSPIETARIGVRPVPEDGFPLVGPVPGTQGLYVVCTHSGVTLGPLLGRIAAREILTGQVDPRIASFRLSRLKETPHHG